MPESPQQIAISEGKNQTLINTTQCLLIESGLDLKFWTEAVSMASYLWNKCQSTSIANIIQKKNGHVRRSTPNT